MASDSWLNGWLAGDVLPAAELSKSMGSFYDSTLGTATASFDVTSVPTWGTSLRFELVGKSDSSGNTVAVKVTVNNDTTANYFDAFGQFTDAAVTQGGNVAAATAGTIGLITGAGASSPLPGIITVEIPHFRGTTFRKPMLGRSYALWNNGSGNEALRTHGVVWNTTPAITRVTFTPTGNWITGSRCTGWVLGP